MGQGATPTCCLETSHRSGGACCHPRRTPPVLPRTVDALRQTHPSVRLLGQRLLGWHPGALCSCLASWSHRPRCAACKCCSRLSCARAVLRCAAQINQGTVVAVGPGRRTNTGELVPVAVKVREWH